MIFMKRKKKTQEKWKDQIARGWGVWRVEQIEYRKSQRHETILYDIVIVTTCHRAFGKTQITNCTT